MNIQKLINELQKLDPTLPVITPDPEYDFVVNPILQRVIQTVGAECNCGEDSNDGPTLPHKTTCPKSQYE